MKKQTYLLLLLPFFILAACSSEAADSTSAIEDRAEEEFEAKVAVPEFAEYPMVSAELVSVPMGSVTELHVNYASEKGALLSDEDIAKYEENAGSEVIYGVYESESSFFNIAYNELEVFSGDGSHETETINGVDVLYQEANSGGNDFLMAFFNAEAGSYTFEFALDEDLTREKAFEMIGTVIEEADM
ncbi:hypothetical protein DHX103_06810 [Planococcus sp. X10-3]|uniref:hypothetical protein n=1 Tax=Planococcus sp. X10-3 TaxID=3061240 RepID=UPI003BAF50FC